MVCWETVILTLSVLAIIPLNCFSEQLYLVVAVVNWTSSHPGGSSLAPPGVGRINTVQCFARYCWTGSVRMGTSHCSFVDGERVMGLLLPPKFLTSSTDNRFADAHWFNSECEYCTASGWSHNQLGGGGQQCWRSWHQRHSQPCYGVADPGMQSW